MLRTRLGSRKGKKQLDKMQTPGPNEDGYALPFKDILKEEGRKRNAKIESLCKPHNVVVSRFSRRLVKIESGGCSNSREAGK